MRVVIAGSREITDYSLVEVAVKLSGFDVSEVVSGCARGVDRLGEQYARRHDLPLRQCPADWAHEGKQAGFNRNNHMASICDAAVLVWDGRSRGSAHMMRACEHASIPHFVLRPRYSGGWEYLAVDSFGYVELGDVGFGTRICRYRDPRA